MSQFLDNFCGSTFWDANLTWNTQQPDLTPCFENTVLVWLPVSVLYIFLPLELYQIQHSSTKYIPWSWVNISKIIVVGLLLIASAVNLIYSLGRDNAYPADIAAPALHFLTFGTIITLIVLHKIHGCQISYLLFFTSLLLVLCQVPRLYSIIRKYILYSLIDDTTATSTHIIAFILMCILLLLGFFCDKPPLYSEQPLLQRPSPEASSSAPSRLTFSWFTPLAQLGSKKALEASDMYSLNHENSSRVIVSQFDKHWLDSVEKTSESMASYEKYSSKVGFSKSPRPKLSILPALCKTFGVTFFTGSCFKFVQDLVIFINPQMLKLMIAFVSSDESMWKGIMYAVLMFVTSIVQMFLLNQYFITMNFTGSRISTALISAIYRKSLKLSNAARKQSTVGELVNLMAVDASSFQQLMIQLNLIWSAPLQICLSLYFLWSLLGPAVLAGLLLMILIVPINIFMVQKTRQLRIKQMKFKDDRIKVINEVLSGVKVLKLYAWEPSFQEKISRIRKKEIQVLTSAAYYNTASNFIFSLTPYLVALVSFTVFVLADNHNILDAETAFVSLSLFNILRFPLSMFPQVINSIVLALVSMKRLNKFMNNEELDPNSVFHNYSEQDQISVENGFFTWDLCDDAEGVLQNINLQIPQGSLVAVVGTVGSGKSSLISAILGEMEVISGKVNTKGSIAYVPQLAWIQNTTLRNNITCVHEFEKSKFMRVVKACALEQDLDMLPGGDMTEIGEKGINLSGGQKQRISLARAVYSKADLYLLDDPLSAVDSHVGKHIFDNVIGPQGVLRKKTRVLVTHGVSFLAETDLIVVMKDGKISERGTYKQLIKNKGAFAEFLLQYLEEAKNLDTESDLEEIKVELMKDATLRQRLTRTISTRSNISSKSSNSERRASVSKESNCSLAPGSKTNLSDLSHRSYKENLMTKEEAEKGNVKLSVFLYYLNAVGVWLAVIAFSFIVLYQAFQVSTNLWLSKWSSDESTVINGTQDVMKTHYYLGIYAALGLGQGVCSIISNLALSLGCLFAASWLHNAMLHRIMRAPMSFFDTTPLGRVMNRFSKDIDTCDSILPMNLNAFFGLTIQVFATISVITYSTPIFIIVFTPIMIFNFLLQRFFVATSRQLKRLESITRSPIYSHFGESVQGAPSIRAYGIQEVFINQSEEKVDFNQSCNFPNMIAMRWLAIRLESVGNLIVFFAALFAVLYRNTLEAGLAGLSITYAMQVTSTLNFFVRTAADVETNIVAVERIKEYAEIDQEADWSVQPKPDDSWPQKGRIEFLEYKVRYREGLELVLGGVSFTIHSGEKVGIVGRTGAGKSSLTLGLFRILEAAGGSIAIDGLNIATVGLHDLRSRLTIIPQDPVLFSGSLRDNLDPFRTETDESLWKALELANLNLFLKSLPAGLNHTISEGGENLSVGQKQLVCLGRALLRKTRVLILDEATAAVDLETDDVIQRTIRTEFTRCTVLTIAHRLNTIMDYDRILVLDRGMVKEFDTPNSLLENNNTIFYSMAKDTGLIS